MKSYTQTGKSRYKAGSSYKKLNGRMGVLGSMKYECSVLFSKHNSKHAVRNKTVSYGTQVKREDVILNGLSYVISLGFNIRTPYAFKKKHFAVIAKRWVVDELTPKTIKTYLSIFKTFCGWINKEGMIDNFRDNDVDLSELKVKYSAQEDKSWSSKEIEEKFTLVSEINPRMAVQMNLMHQFGLRKKEGLLMRPHLSDKTAYLDVTRGTKGGRPRVISIVTIEQRQALDAALAICPRKDSSMIPEEFSSIEWINKFNYVLRKCGITRKNGLVVHGLRHGYAQRQYTKRTGVECPIKGGDTSNVPKDVNSFACLDIAEDLGHSRQAIVSMYIGSEFTKKIKESDNEL